MPFSGYQRRQGIGEELTPVQRIRFTKKIHKHFSQKKNGNGKNWTRFGEHEAQIKGTRAADQSTRVLNRT